MADSLSSSIQCAEVETWIVFWRNVLSVYLEYVPDVYIRLRWLCRMFRKAMPVKYSWTCYPRIWNPARVHFESEHDCELDKAYMRRILNWCKVDMLFLQKGTYEMRRSLYVKRRTMQSAAIVGDSSETTHLHLLNHLASPSSITILSPCVLRNFSVEARSCCIRLFSGTDIALSNMRVNSRFGTGIFISHLFEKALYFQPGTRYSRLYDNMGTLTCAFDRVDFGECSRDVMLTCHKLLMMKKKVRGGHIRCNVGGYGDEMFDVTTSLPAESNETMISLPRPIKLFRTFDTDFGQAIKPLHGFFNFKWSKSEFESLKGRHTFYDILAHPEGIILPSPCEIMEQNMGGSRLIRDARRRAKLQWKRAHRRYSQPSEPKDVPDHDSENLSDSSFHNVLHRMFQEED